MSKDCGHHHGSDYYCCYESFWCECKISKKWRRILLWLAVFVVLVLLAILIVWLALRPTKPKFYLQDVSVFTLNLTGSAFLSTNIQVTLDSHNPNSRIGIYYGKLDIYASYKGQQITVPSELPPTYQGHDDLTVNSPYLCGTDVPLGPYLTASFAQDQAAGYVLIDVRVQGQLRWKVGTWISGYYHIDVSCPAFLTTVLDGPDTPGFHFKPISQCNVDI